MLFGELLYVDDCIVYEIAAYRIVEPDSMKTTFNIIHYIEQKYNVLNRYRV